jgi:uncharacterized protein (TIGR02271 family)
MTQSVVGLFNSFTEANSAKQQLVHQGFSASDIVVSAHEGDMPEGDMPTTDTSAHISPSQTGSSGGFMAGVENFFSDLFGGSNSDDAGHYTEAVRRGGAVVTVTIADDSKLDTARSALASVGAVNVEERVAAWRTTGYTSYQKNSTPFTADQVAEERARVIPVIQENLEVGKRQVDMGAVRVVSRLVETPVTENVTLREEHATIERRPVDRPATEADLHGAQSIEVRETAEKAVISKTAHVVEEVVVGKEATSRTEQISDTVRSTVVDVDKSGTTGTTGTATHVTGTSGTGSTIDPVHTADSLGTIKGPKTLGD